MKTTFSQEVENKRLASKAIIVEIKEYKIITIPKERTAFKDEAFRITYKDGNVFHVYIDINKLINSNTDKGLRNSFVIETVIGKKTYRHENNIAVFVNEYSKQFDTYHI